MQPFTVLTAIAMPLMRANVNTDEIIPSREMKRVSKTGLEAGLFAGWRYTETGGRVPDPTFVMNRPEYAEAEILISGPNFGCGSSREHAVWALAEHGFRAVIAASFHPIFEHNCVPNGVVPVRLAQGDVEVIATWVQREPEVSRVTVDLVDQIVSAAGARFAFALGPDDREMLLEGLDAIDLTLKSREAILAFREADRVRRPWGYL